MESRKGRAGGVLQRLRCPKARPPSGQLSQASTVELSVAALDEDAPLPGKKKKDDKTKAKE